MVAALLQKSHSLDIMLYFVKPSKPARAGIIELT